MPPYLLLALATVASAALAGCASENESNAGPGEESVCEGVDTGSGPVERAPDSAPGDNSCPVEPDVTSGVPGVTSPDANEA